MDDLKEYVQLGFAGIFALLLLWKVSDKLDNVCVVLSAMKETLDKLTDQQDGGYKMVVEALISSVNEHRK